MKKTIIFLFFSMLEGYSQTDKIQFLNTHEAEFDIVSSMMFFEDTSSKMTIDDIMLAKKSNRLTQTHGQLSFGVSNSVFWLYFKFQNEGNDSTLILRLQDPGIDMIQVYNSNKLIDSLGDVLPFYNRKIVDKDFVIRIPSKPHLTYDYYIRVEKKGQTLSIPIQLLKENLYQKRQKNEYLFWGLFWGVIIALILLNFITFLNFREKVFLYSCVYIFFFATFCTTGLGYEYLWYNYPIFGQYDSGIAAMATIAFHILFIQAFVLQTEAENSKLFYLNRSIVLILLVLIFLGIFGIIKNRPVTYSANYVITKFLLYLILVYIVLVLLNIYDGFKKEKSNIYFVLFSVLSIFASLIITFCVKSGLIYLPFASTYVVPIGVLLDSFIITYAQMKRFNAFARERNYYFLELLKAQNQTIQIQETERTRLAQDLHDDLGGTLSAIKGKVANETKNPETLKLVEKAIEDLRSISRNLLPPELAKKGISEAIQQSIERLQSAAINFTFITFGKEKRMSEERELNIYRVISELLNNIIKHSKATKATVQVIFYEEYVHISVEDNGIGIKTEEKNWGIGLKNVNSRVEFLKAKLLKDSNVNGTTFIVEVSYN